jgi:hypothetical protein
MRKRIAWLWVVGSFGCSAAAMAQTPPAQLPVTKYDGTYAFISSSKVNETYTTVGAERLGRCGDLPPRGPLTIVNSHARYNKQEGTVGPQGELAMRLDPTPLGKGGGQEGIEVTTSGTIDANGTVRARRTGYYCRYDLIWRKILK